MPLETTVIGSYPPVGETPEERMRNAIEDQISAGVHKISDGQTRYDMIEYVARAINAFEPYMDGNAKRWKIARRVDSFAENIDAGEAKADFEYLQKACSGRAKPAFMIAGPLTLTWACVMNRGAYEKKFRDPELYMDVAKAELAYIKLIGADKASSVHIDEPFISQAAKGVFEMARPAIEYIAKNIDAEVNLHMCGDATKPISPDSDEKIFEALLKLSDVDVISHGFMGSAEKNNRILLTVEPRASQYKKKLGLGCVDSGSEFVESEDIIRQMIGFAIESQGKENLVIHPDCGLSKLPREVAYNKLKNMCKAAASFE